MSTDKRSLFAKAPRTHAVECKSEIGITVGLIDSIISTCRVLAPRLKEHENKTPGFVGEEHPILAALEDLHGDEDLKTVLGVVHRWYAHMKTVYPNWPGKCRDCRTEHPLFTPCPQNDAFLGNKGRGGKPRTKDTAKTVVYDFRVL
jgi:hypothetical protein